MRPVFKSCKSHSSRVFFADAGGSHQADMSQETLVCETLTRVTVEESG